MSAPTDSTTQPRALDLSAAVLGRPLVIQHSRLAGFSHHAAPALWAALRSGAHLSLTAEQDNPHDPLAVAVYWRGCKLGYLPRAENLVVAQLLARHRILGARIRRLHPGADNDQQLELDILML